MKVQKIPSLTCKECGSFCVMMTDDGPECESCNKNSPSSEHNLSSEIEYLINQLRSNDKKLHCDE